MQSSTSLPGSPFTLNRGSQFNWRRQIPMPLPMNHAGISGGFSMRSNSRRPLVLPCLENLDLPYADDSAAATPSSDDLCSFQNAQNYLTLQHQQRQQRLNSTASHGSNRMSQLEMRFAGGGGGGAGYGASGVMSRKGSRASRHSRQYPVGSLLGTSVTTTQIDFPMSRLKVKCLFFAINIRLVPELIGVLVLMW